MAKRTNIFRRSSGNSSEPSQEPIKSEYGVVTHEDVHVPEAVDERTALHRGLKARHVAMIAIGGALGTGLLIGTGVALQRAYASSLLSLVHL